jgi:serine/threonine protein kinase
MASESVTQFLDKAQASRVLHPDQVADLFRSPEAPQDDLSAVCSFLEQQGALTRYQVEQIRQGRGDELTFAGYPILERLPDLPSGPTFKALHPSLRTPVYLRHIHPDWVAPADTIPSFLQRAQAASLLTHPNMVHVLDVGEANGTPYVALEFVDGRDLRALVKDIGPMPVFLAAEFGRQLAQVLQFAHERGQVHRDVRPANLIAAPVIRSSRKTADGRQLYRPAQNAALKLADLGLIPVRPTGLALAQQVGVPAGLFEYLPPERVDQTVADPRADLYGLGASLYYVLSGRPPFAAQSPDEMLGKVKAVEPAPLELLRPDAPAPLINAVKRLMSKRAENRPESAQEVADALAPLCRQSSPAVAVPTGVSVPAEYPPDASNAFAFTSHHRRGREDEEPVDAHLQLESSEPPFGATGFSGWVDEPADDGPAQPQETLAPRKPPAKKNSTTWIVAGVCLHLTAIALLVAWLAGAFTRSSPPPQDPPKKEQKAKTTSKKYPPMPSK